MINNTIPVVLVEHITRNPVNIALIALFVQSKDVN